jgi:hypothetical protein
VDEVRGRFYSMSTGLPNPQLHTLAVLGLTRTPLADQGLVFRVPLHASPKLRAPVVDSGSRRVFWDTEEGYAVLEDRLAMPPLPEPPDPDAATSDIAEGPGTGVNFLGAGRSYGGRLRWVGGLGGPERNVNTVMDTEPKNFVRSLLPQSAKSFLSTVEGTLPPDPQGGTRDYHFGRVMRATLGNGEASAEAIGADRDTRNTDTDLANLTSYLRDRGGPDLTDGRWPYSTAACTDFGGSAGKDAHTGASVSCMKDGEQVIGSARNEGPWNAGPVLVGDSRASSYAVRDPQRGIVSVATAEVTDLDLGGLAGIGRVTARAETWAAGRPGTAGSRFVRAFEDAWVTTDGERRMICDAQCDPRTLQAALGRALGPRVQITFPAPDEARAKGTPGGFEALVVRDAFEQTNDIAVNDEVDVRLEVPAMEITVVADGRIRSRVVASLAAVSAESHYGVFRLAQGSPAGPARPALGAPVAAPVLAAKPSPPPEAQVIEQVTIEPGGLMGKLVRKVFDGLRWFFASPANALRAMAMWTLLAAPLFLLTRRRALDSVGPGG